MSKITVGIPSYDHIKTECVISLMNLVTRNQTLDLDFFFNQSLYIDYNRNQLVDVAMQNGSSHLLFIDSDIAFPPDGPERLLAHDKDIVGGYYNTRRGNNPIRFLEDGQVVSKDLPSELFQCHILPTGFMLIRLECLQRLQKPYFAVITHHLGTVGEDVTFCKKAQDAGIEIWCDPTIKLGHVGKKIY